MNTATLTKPDSIQITATELKKNLGKYLKLTQEKDIYITKNDTKIAKLTDLKQERLTAMKSLFGILKNDGKTPEEIREERIVKRAKLN